MMKILLVSSLSSLVLSSGVRDRTRRLHSGASRPVDNDRELQQNYYNNYNYNNGNNYNGGANGGGGGGGYNYYNNGNNYYGEANGGGGGEGGGYNYYNYYGGGNDEDMEAYQNGNYNYKGNYQSSNGYNGGNYDNFEEYMSAQMGSRSFSFVGCSTPTDGSYGSFVTFRMCDECSDTRNGGGCGIDNGEFVISLQEYAEYYGEYVEETYEMESPFECVNAEEFAENMKSYQYAGDQAQGQDQGQEGYQNGYYQYQNQGQDQGQQQGNQNGYYQNAQQSYQNIDNQMYEELSTQSPQYKYQNQYNNNNNNNNNELYIGPYCRYGGESIEYAVFSNDECTYLAKGVSVQQLLGGRIPDNSNLQPKQCVRCNKNSQNWYYEDMNQEVELISLCDEMIQTAGRCDRDEDLSEFDKFWRDVVRIARGIDEQEDNGYYNKYSNNNYNGAAGYSYYSSHNQNICSFIDRTFPGTWDKMKKSASESGLSHGALIAIIVLVPLAVVVPLMYFAYWIGYNVTECCNNLKNNDSSDRKVSLLYHRDDDPVLKKVNNASAAPPKPTSHSSIIKPSSQSSRVTADTAPEKPTSQFTISSDPEEQERDPEPQAEPAPEPEPEPEPELETSLSSMKTTCSADNLR